MKVTYDSYLKVSELLRLQEPRSNPPEHDELLFIVIHQVYELWFRVLLQELDKAGRDLSAGDLFGALATFKRCRTIMKTLVGQLDILETMTSLSFSAFRDRLETASGFQSAQFREMEFVLGHKREESLRFHEKGSDAWARLNRRLSEPSLVDHLYDFLASRGAAIPDEIRSRDPRLPAVANEAVQDEALRLYRNAPDVAILIETIVDLDEGVQEWRYRHVKLTERAIGNKAGTGGSSGIEYLKSTLFRPAFADLWAIRSRL